MNQLAKHHRRIYVASSWRNVIQPEIVAALRDAGHEVYDFRNPAPGQKGFAWRDCGGLAATDGPGSGATTIPSYLEAINSERARDGFRYDKEALEWCDTCILVLPCGRSAHLELGYAAGQGKDTYVLLHEDKFEPELMYLLNTAIATSIEDVIDVMALREPGDALRWQVENGGYLGRVAGHALRFLREAVELCIAAGAAERELIRHVSAEISKANARNEFGGNEADIPGEIADCRILLDVIAKHVGVDQRLEVRRKLDVLWHRAWESDIDGVLWRPGHVPDWVKRHPSGLAEGAA